MYEFLFVSFKRSIYLQNTAQGGRGQHLGVESTKLDSTNVDSTRVSVDDTYDTLQNVDWGTTRDVRTRPTPRVRDANTDILARILSLTAGLPRDARDAVQSAVAVARSANELTAILGDLANAASDTVRDELYWRGEAEDTNRPEVHAEYHTDAENGETNAQNRPRGSSSAINFRALGPHSVTRTEVSFYWPSLGFAATQRQSSFVNAVVFRPDPNETDEDGFGRTTRRNFSGC